jgi:hypothetical protein
MINAVFNFANFWDGRANNVFNGQNPFGRQDPNARVWALQTNGTIALHAVALENASLASQAVGPPLSHFEMSFGDPDNGNARTFPEIGKKLLRGTTPIKPLAKQLVSSTDSALGALSSYPSRGLKSNYRAMIQNAFNKKWWGYTGTIDMTGASVAYPLTASAVRQAQNGKNVIEPMLLARGTALYDNGFYNIGVTPTTDDLRRGGRDLNGKPLSWSRQVLFQRVIGLPMGFPITGDNGILAVDEEGNQVCTDKNRNGFCDAGEPFSAGFQRVATDGAFKTPGLRNQRFMGPYMHNGGLATLRQVVEFYNRGGNFCRLNLPDLDPDIRPLGLSSVELDNLVSFLLSLTDERVRLEKAPFDHPELLIPANGSDEREAALASGPARSSRGGQPALRLDRGSDGASGPRRRRRCSR